MGTLHGKPGKKRIKNTKFGRRALRNARTGGPSIKNPGGSTSSVKTMTVTVSDRVGRRGKVKSDTLVVPTIRQRAGGKLERLSPKAAADEAIRTGDFVRVRGGAKPKKIERSIKRGTRISQKFSNKLGKIGEKRRKKEERRRR